MSGNFERPLDLLNNSKGKDISVEMKGKDKPLEGKLIAFDIHINLIMEVNGKPKFVRGDIVETISPKK